MVGTLLTDMLFNNEFPPLLFNQGVCRLLLKGTREIKRFNFRQTESGNEKGLYLLAREAVCSHFPWRRIDIPLKSQFALFKLSNINFQ